MSESADQTQKKSVFETPLLSTKVKSANVKILPEAGIGYFIGPTLAILSNSILCNYFNKYMQDVLQVDQWASTFFTLLPLISVIFVVLGNIVVGRVMDHMHTKAGKARPLLLISIPLSILALLVLFVFMPVSLDAAGVPEANVWTLVCCALGYNLWFSVAYPFYYTSHSALVNLSTRNSSHRSLLATCSQATQLAAIGLTSMILPFCLGLLFVENDNGSYDIAASINHWRIFAIAMMCLCGIGAFLEYFFTRERITEESFSLSAEANQNKPAKKAVPVSKQAGICLRDKYWWIIIVFYFLYQFGGQLKNVSQLYYCQAWFPDENGVYNAVSGGSYSGTISIVGAIPTALGMVIAWPLARKLGKSNSILFGALLSCIGGFLGFIAPDNFAMVITAFVLKALGSTPAMYIGMSLLSDMLDHEEAMYGVRTDGLTMTVYGSIMVGMAGLATGIINAVNSAVGYASTSTTANTAFQTAMTWIFFGGEAICYLAIAVIMIFMKVEKYSNLDHEAIELDHKEVAEAQGIEYVPASVRLAQEEAQSKVDSYNATIEELRVKCEKKGLDFETERKAYDDQQTQKAAANAQKKADNDAKKAAKKAEKDAANQAKLDAMTADERAAYDQKLADKAAKKAAADEKLREAFEDERALHAETRQALIAEYAA